MYKEKQLQESRIRNFVVKGLSVNSHDDKRRIEELCQNELNVSPEIVSCRRLGKVITGKVQPVLVTVSSEEDARSVISLARNLRRSNDAFVRDNVYINPDLTKAQADAAYQARRHRRQVQSARNGLTNVSSVQATTVQSVPLSDVSGSTLQPSAPEFIP